VAYAVKVTHAERELFERQQGWSIKKMYSSKKSKSSPGPGDAASSEIREPAEEYAPVIFAQDAYKHVVSFDMLSGEVRLSFLTFKISPFPTPQARGREKARKLQSLVFAMCSSLLLQAFFATGFCHFSFNAARSELPMVIFLSLQFTGDGLLISQPLMYVSAGGP
jgi:hypothetical protein